ncbi:MAG: SusC/RagA family TonB-linked outer membrane protein [Reichenbachiella sp.]|uniref:SusC/RagA family TonB-linked outer membrane protein n=1 Tax=Reichenbachiella sp. TaxID=2184521 RepID=UPI0032984E72
MKKFLLLTSVVSAVMSNVWAQSTIKGTVSSEGENLPGVSVLVEGSAAGTVTDIDGNYSVEVPDGGKTLIFTFIGMATERVEIASRSQIDVSMTADATELSEVVVTALGLERDKASLGYAVQQVDGDAINTAKEENFIRSLSGKIAGVNVRAASTMGGGTNILIRGNSSLSGNNQPLFVVDGVPVNNSSYNSSSQLSGGGGYDFGNSASDINPDDIESVSVLKGGSASVLYGSRAANGVILITTKKGTTGKTKITVSSGVTFSKIDESTLPEYQNEYGGGYGGENMPIFSYDPAIHPSSWASFDGQEMVEYDADASWGPKFDPNRNVRHWDSWDESDPENFGQVRPWVATPNGIESFFETGVAISTNISLEGGNAKNSFRVGYTDYRIDGTMPNSTIDRRTFNASMTNELSEKLRSTFSANVVRSEAEGRAGTGYSDDDGISIMAAFGNWHQRQLDISRMTQWKTVDGIQRSWNRSSYDNPNPAYWDNPYWTRNENVQSDNRDRFYGKYELTYDVLDWISVTGRAGLDFSKFFRDYRIAKGGVVEYVGRGAYPLYAVNENIEKQQNYDLFANIEKHFNNQISMSAIIGANFRQQNWEGTTLGTRDGLVLPDVYAISNSASDNVNFSEWNQERKDHAVYGTLNLSYADLIYAEGSYRHEWSSTMKSPFDFGYYAGSLSFVFSELDVIKSFSALSFGKLRASFAKTGNAPVRYRTNEVPNYTAGDKFNGNPAYYVQSVVNGDLEPEITKDVELGAELAFFSNRLKLDFAWYKRRSYNQLLNVPVSGSSGVYYSYANTGEIENDGIELALNATPLQLGKFNWNVNINFSKNNNKVTALPESLESIEIASVYELKQLHIQGEDYGSFYGRDYVYDDEGRKVINSFGTYELSDPKVLGSIVPDYEMGITNTFSNGNLSLNVLIDIKKGGEIYSQSHRWLRETGNAAETVGTNDLGFPIRNDYSETIDDGNGNQIANPAQGGVILDGVVADGSENTTRISASDAHHDSNNPESASIFDASYIKLREMSLNYSLPKSVIGNTPFTMVSLSLTGRNLAILQKNAPIDPEVSYGVGNSQGIDWGMLPRERSYGFKITAQF